MCFYVFISNGNDVYKVSKFCIHEKVLKLMRYQRNTKPYGEISVLYTDVDTDMVDYYSAIKIK